MNIPIHSGHAGSLSNAYFLFPKDLRRFFSRRPGYQTLFLTRGFVSPPHDGFTFIGKSFVAHTNKLYATGTVLDDE